MSFDRNYARRLDAADELASYRAEFVTADSDLVYMLGNSLGRLPRQTVRRLEAVVRQEWGRRLIRGWNDGWIHLAQRIGDKIGRLLGASPGEVLVADSTSVNLYKLALAALHHQQRRRTILTDDLNFPSDLYILQAAAKSGGDRTLRLVPSRDGIHGPEGDLIQAVNDDTALVSLSHTVFKSAFVYDMATVTKAAHDAGALVLWDMSHSVGAVNVDLSRAKVDLAVGCTYKYLNGGPGAPALLYVRKELQDELLNPIPGWMGEAEPFTFDQNYSPAPGLRRFLTGTPSILSLSAIEPGVDLLLAAGMETVRAKSRQLTDFLVELWRAELQPLGFELRSPLEGKRRGSHVAFGHPEALRISRALRDVMNVLPDFRAPDNLRFAVSPLYTSFEEVFEAVQRLRKVVIDQLYEDYPPEAPVVT
jgi:kynureninase